MNTTKILTSFLTVFSLSLMFPSITACSDDDSTPGCYQEDSRDIVATLTSVEGTIRGVGSFCPDDFTIEPDNKSENRPLGAFAPCNLQEEFKVADLRVVFSGHVYESFETEDICADFFEITDITIVKP